MSNAIWKRSNATWTVEQFIHLWDKLDLRPEYQREFVWNRKLQCQLISSILSDAAIPQIMLWKKPGFNYDVIDGQQRLQTIHNFFSDELTLMPDTLFNGENIGRARYSTMPDDAKMAFLNYTFFVHIIDTNSYELIIEQFLRLQSGKPLSKQDKRDARLGTVKEMVDVISQHEAFDRLCVRHKVRRVLALRLIVLEHYEHQLGPNDTVLDSFSIKYHGIGINSFMAQSLMSKVHKRLSKMMKVFSTVDTEMYESIPGFDMVGYLFSSQIRFLDAYSLLDMLEQMSIPYEHLSLTVGFYWHVNDMDYENPYYSSDLDKKDVDRSRAKAAVASLYKYEILS